ncbi:RsmB/NOP family class I SAM-dependent RNA methyltransferase [Roseovarius arcticus]|uniref:RsmB/NOP family class I SAM-dependent RNA methyltransferase n=1 Tax=Roseovarius arcticus TaxID=2547404 RepID=UPI001110CBF1|nr:RsmB/NOP family class I SAM-dependent RNA methyltransferase [Roseovarius arcticus]
MTPGARVQAAIELLDSIDTGGSAEKVLTSWGRRSRFAGSGDRAAVRDHVFQVLRCYRSYACLGGAQTGRGRMIGALRAEGLDPADTFTGEGHAPAPLTNMELSAGVEPVGADALDLNDWVLDEFRASLGSCAEAAAMALRTRAPVMVRVDLRRATRDDAIGVLAGDNISSAVHPIATTALCITGGARRIARSRAYLDGMIELQDGSGQAAMEAIELEGVQSILDYCAGGGGKALALATRSDARIYVHDVDPSRMQDIPARAARAGVSITSLLTSALPRKAPYDIVLCDAPCSGSGTWRRTPEAKWRLTSERLTALTQLQSQILPSAAALVAPKGQLIYATCSLLKAENEDRIDAFLSTVPGWKLVRARRFDVTDGGDGFFLARMIRL